MYRNSFLLITTIAVWAFIFSGCRNSIEETRTFYKVSLTCNAAPQIAWGSRVKPLFLEAEQIEEIKESWINREGTVLAFIWKEQVTSDEKANFLQPLFEKHRIDAELITDDGKKKHLTESFFSNHAPAQKGKDKWYKEMEVDLLSREEASSLSDSATAFARGAELINESESLKIKAEIEEYMKTELVKVRSYKELTSDETDLKWKKQGYEVYIKHIGSERAEKVRDYYIDYQKKILKKDTLK